VDTKMARRTRSDEGLLERVAFWQPLGPIGEVGDVAEACVYLASDEAKFVTGVVLPIDGGWTAQ
jgi:NAD(P)-dependent dehydrogenase (short-subunit alcohol dehydrogenase family)